MAERKRMSSPMRRALAASPLPCVGLFLAFTLVGCSEESEPPPPPPPASLRMTPPPQPFVMVERILAGAGLEGLPGFEATLLPQAEAERLMRLAYPGQPSQLVTVRDGAELYNARPFAALRLPERTILIVQNENSTDCHACSGRTSLFYFDAAGQSLTNSFPLVLEGADWGGPQEIRVIDVGGPTLLLRSDFQQQGYYFEGYQLARLALDRVELLGTFPSLASNDGTIEQVIYRVQLAGAGLSGDGRSLTLRYTGRQTSQPNAVVRPIEEERSITLDGVADPWVQGWGQQAW
jgi:hypothetical protein